MLLIWSGVWQLLAIRSLRNIIVSRRLSASRVVLFARHAMPSRIDCYWHCSNIENTRETRLAEDEDKDSDSNTKNVRHDEKAESRGAEPGEQSPEPESRNTNRPSREWTKWTWSPGDPRFYTINPGRGKKVKGRREVEFIIILNSRYARHTAEVIIYQMSDRLSASLYCRWLLAFLVGPCNGVGRIIKILRITL